ncbi:MAG TPA: MFS transporter, partial [Planctomycetaceae bacterium]|nr:MFS transporter [Planctomycetaceae bacterium]
RGLSTLCLVTQSEPAPIPAGLRWLSWRETWSRASTGTTGRLLLFAVAMQCGVFVAGPFFNPYILKVLQFSYSEYAALLGASFVAKFLVLPLWGKFAHQFGAQRLLWVGAIGLIPLAGGWNVSSNYGWLLALQLVAGAAWGAYELALVLLFFETISERERTSVLTLYNVANSGAILVGSAIGAVILQTGAVSAEAYHRVYAASTLLRLLAVIQLVVFWPKNMPSGDQEPAFQPMLCQPNMGSLDQPVLSSSPRDSDGNLRASA